MSSALLTSPSPSDGPAAPIVVQRYPALVPVPEQVPPTYPFAKINLPAAGVCFATRLTYVATNQSPIFPGHVLVMPRSNKERVHQLTPEELSDLWLVAQHVARVFEARFDAQAMTFAIQDGVEAGQKIPCVHIHVIPRKKADLVNKDEVYDLIEKNVPESTTGTVDGSVVAAAASVSSSHVAKPDGEQPKPSSSLRENLEEVKRVFHTRAEQAEEARKFAQWLVEAGCPKYLEEKLQVEQTPSPMTPLVPAVASPIPQQEQLNWSEHHPEYTPSEGESAFPSYLSRNSYGLCLRAKRRLEKGTLVATGNLAPSDLEYTAGSQDKAQAYVAVSAVTQDGQPIYSRVRGRWAFCNHSCQPSCEVGEGFLIRTVRTVEPDEELTTPYDGVIPGLPWQERWNMSCLCGTPTCRGWIDSYRPDLTYPLGKTA
jgi:bis(5'-adenosyl)-triphosphatase